MTVDITQDEMNVLNLNGISEDDIKSNIEYSRAAGLDDTAIREQFSTTINQLKPITKQSYNDAAKIKDWKNKGEIGAFEYANKKAMEYYGNYDNIDNNVNLNAIEKNLKNSSINNTVDERIAKGKQAKLERNQRVNSGDGSFLDRAGAALDRWGDASYKQQANDQTAQRTMAIPEALIDNLKVDPNNNSKINFGTSLGRSFLSGEWLPFVGGFISGAEDKKMRDIKARIVKNEPIREDELKFLNYKLEQQQEEQVRGFTYGGQIAKDFLPSLVRFGGEMAAAGWVLKGLGLASEAPQAASIGQKALHGLGEMGKYGVAGAVLPTGWNETFGTYQDRMKSNEMEFTDKGAWLFKESNEKPATAFLKSLGSVFSMFASEASGELIGIPVQGAKGAMTKYLGTPVGKYLRENKQLLKFVDNTFPALSKMYEKMNKMPVKGKSLDWLKSQVKFDGFIEEMGEEAVEDVLSLTLGINNEDRSLENYSKAIFKSPDEWAVIAGAIALQGGTLSAASHILGGYMERSGATDEEILDVMQKSSESDKEKMIENLISDGLLDVSKYTNEEQNRINNLKNHFYTQNKNAGLEDAEGLATAEIQSQSIAKLAKNIGMDIDTVKKAFNITTESMTNEQAQEQYETDTKVLQGRVEKHNQELQSKEAIENIEKSFGDSVENLTQYIKSDVSNIINENNLDESEFNFEDIRFYGSYTKGKNKKTSDLDVLVQYSGSMREDAAFNMFADAKLYITDAAGKKIKVDINPINTAKSGTINEHLTDLDSLQEDGRLFQTAKIAGAEAADTQAAIREWNEKGTGSEYFKKWFGDSKVVDEGGKPIVVYHGTENNFKIFKNTGKSSQIGTNIGFFFTDSKKMAKQYGNDVRVLPTYLSLKNPLIIEPDSTITIFGQDLEIKDAFDFFTKLDTLKSEQETREELIKQGYDGIILKSTNVDTPFREDIHDVFVAFNPEQIKSVNNQGTFDVENPNIYYQRRKIKEAPGQLNFNFDEIMQMQLFQNNQIFKSENKNGSNVETEIKEQYTKTDAEIKSNEQDNLITDAGDSLLGNLKKNKKQYSWQELESMNDLLRNKYLSKSYIYQMPILEELKAEGLSDRTAAFVYNVYSKINAKPARGYDSINDQQLYFNSVQEIMSKTIDFAKQNNELISENNTSSIRDELFKIIYPDVENKKQYSVFRAYPEYNKQAIITGGNKLIGSFYLDYQTNKDIEKTLARFNSENKVKETQKETLSGWQRYFDIVQSRNGWFVADRKSGMIYTDRDLPTQEIAETYAQKFYDYIKEKEAKSSNAVDFSNLRSYIPRRQDNQNVNPEALIDVFGFRGINFGNWTKQSERQDFVNLAYDSFYDLAELLNLPPNTLSLGGKLGLAFGSQGRSRAAGHFIPEYNEINLTRKNGAGSLAHEWWHALDYYFGDQSTGKDFSGKASLALREQGLLRDEVFAALTDIKEQMKYTSLSEEDLKNKSNYIENNIKRAIEFYAGNIKNTFRKSKRTNEINNFVDDLVKNAAKIDFAAERDSLEKTYLNLLDENRRTLDNLQRLNNLVYQLKKLANVSDIAKAHKKYTEYYNKAAKLNVLAKGMGSDYWTKDTELGARAFSSYILNKIAQKEYKNNFLARDEKAEISFDFSVMADELSGKDKKDNDKSFIVEWYPANSAERERIFKAFDNLFSKIKTRNENEKAILYQKNNDYVQGFTYQRFNFDGTTKDNLIVLLKNKSDKSTLLHEFAHVYLTTLNKLAKENARAKDLLITVNKWLRYNGVEYTKAQHEKFANGFVGYVKTGKAPTYGLKKAFENFKKWLNDLYTDLQISDDVEIDDDTKKVFDELLGDMTIDAQKKISDDIIEKARHNALLRLGEEKREKENVNFNQLTDKQRRYRETAYDILWYALSHTKNKEGLQLVKDKRQLYMLLGNNAEYNKKTKGVKHQQEKLTLILSEIDDVFSGNDGFLPEWGEFFYDPGVSYKTDDMMDAELALQALDVIVSKKYLYDTDTVYEELSHEDIKRAEYELEYIVDVYRDAQEKTNALLAFYEWTESLHPYIQEDFVNKWETKTNEIDRYQSLSKFQQAKEDLKIYAATLKGHGDYSSQFAEFARKVLKRLDFMTEYDKAKIFDKLKDYNSFREIERNLDDVMDYAETLSDVSERKTLAADIVREVKQTIHEWNNGIKKTKYTYPANKLFTRLREIERMKQEEIQNLYDAQVNEEITLSYVADQVHDDDYYKTIEKMFVTFKANGNYYNSTEFLQDLLERIQSAKFTAKVARDEIDFERRMQQINLIDECAKALDTHKGKTSAIEKAYRHAFNLNSALTMMFDENVKNKFTLDYLYAQKDAKVGKDRDEVLNKIAKIFGFKGAAKNTLLFNKFIDMTKKEFKIKQRYSPDMVNGTYRVTSQDKESGQTITEQTVTIRPENEQHSEWSPDEQDLSRMEVLYYYIQAKNSISYKMLTDMGDETTPAKGQFDRAEFHELIDNLTEQEKLMGDILQMAAEKYYPELNKYHIEKYHVELGKVNAYYPRKSETQEVRVLEMFNDYVQQMSKQGFQKIRTAGVGVRIAPANALAVLFDHIEKAHTLIVMGRQLDTMNRVFKDSNLNKKIEAVWGIDTTKEFMLQVTANLYGGQASTISDAEAQIGRIENNVIKSQIFAKPQVGLKQILSFMNYGVGDEFVSTAEWSKEFAKQTFTPKEWKSNVKFMMDIDYLKDRFSRGGSTDALKRQLEQRMFAKISLFDDAFSSFIRVGDIGAIVLGGKPYIDVLLNKGYTKEQAIKIFIEKTVNDQQSSIPSTLSNIQRNAAKQPLAKMFFAYQNTPWQYFRTASNSIIKFKQNPNKYTGLNMVKLVGLYMYIFPLIFNLTSSLSPLILASTGDDDELMQDIWKSIIGGVTFIPIAGMFINSIYAGFQGEKASTGNWFDTAAGKAGNIIRKIKKDDFTPLDIYNAASLFGEAFTGIPFTTLGTGVTGAADVVSGDIAKGAMKLGGYTDYRAKAVTGEK